MALKKYVALATVDYIDADGKRQFAKPAHKGRSGLFSADYSDAQVRRLTDAGAIRVATNKDIADDRDAPTVEVQQLPASDGLGDMKVEALKALAEDEKVDLGEAKTKVEIVEAIRAARLKAAGDDLLND